MSQSINKSKTKNLLFWIPGILTILFAIFLSIFAFDVFGEEQGLLKILIHFVLHLTPTFIILLILIVFWKKELVLCLMYVLLAILYIIWSWGRFSSFIPYLVICGSLLLISILFFLGWLKKVKNGV